MGRSACVCIYLCVCACVQVKSQLLGLHVKYTSVMIQLEHEVKAPEGSV